MGGGSRGPGAHLVHLWPPHFAFSGHHPWDLGAHSGPALVRIWWEEGGSTEPVEDATSFLLRSFSVSASVSGCLLCPSRFSVSCVWSVSPPLLPFSGSGPCVFVLTLDVHVMDSGERRALVFSLSPSPLSLPLRNKWRHEGSSPCSVSLHLLLVLCCCAFLCSSFGHVHSVHPPPLSLKVGGGGWDLQLESRGERGKTSRTQRDRPPVLSQLLPRPGPRLDLLLPAFLPRAQPAGPAHSHALHQRRPTAADTEGQAPPTPPALPGCPGTSPALPSPPWGGRGGGSVSPTHSAEGRTSPLSSSLG